MTSHSHDKVQALIRELDSHLKDYEQRCRGMTWRQKVLLLVEARVSLKELGKHSDPEAAKVGARDRLRLYLKRHVGVAIHASELEVVSGISEYARRVRELRVEEGYKVLTGHSNDPGMGLSLGPSQYLLVSGAPDHLAARRWKLANRIRRDKSLGSQDKLLAYFKASVGEVMTTEELSYVAKNARQYARRVRELRTEHGYAIATRFTGRPDLNMGEYVMESKDRIAEPHDRQIPFDVQKAVYERDESRCLLCGWTRERWSRQDPRILELHHLQQHAEGGHNSPENLVVICSRCHDEVHAGRRAIPDGILE